MKKMWAIKSDGELFYVSDRKGQAIRQLTSCHTDWKWYYSRGYRAVRVKVSEIKK